MELTPKKRRKLAQWVIGVAAVCIVLIFGMKNLSIVREILSNVFSLVMPLIIGLIFALVINVPMSFLESRLSHIGKKPMPAKLRRIVSFVLSLVMILGVVAGVVWLVIPELIEAVKVIVDGSVHFVNQLSSMTDEEIAQLPFGKIWLDIDWDTTLHKLEEWIKNRSGEIVNTAVETVSSVASGVYDFFIAFVFSVYIIFSKEILKNQCSRLICAWIPKKIADTSIHATKVLSKNFRNFVTGQTLEAVILGVLCMIGMLILQIPYAPMVGALVGVTAIIPIVGAFIGAGVGAFMIFTVSPIKALVFLVFIIILQQLEGNIIYPKVMGTSVSLPGIWILASVSIGGSIAGATGMLLAVPIASTVYTLLIEATKNREKKMEKSPKGTQD